MSLFLAQLIRSRWAHVGALAVILLSILLPQERGFGVPLCTFREVTHLPCLACGLTRSYIALAHFNVSRAVFFHPLGLVLFPLTLLLAALLITPAAVRMRLARWTERTARPLHYLGIGFLAALIVYGLGRMGWLLMTHRPSPW